MGWEHGHLSGRISLPGAHWLKNTSLENKIQSDMPYWMLNLEVVSPILDQLRFFFLVYNTWKPRSIPGSSNCLFDIFWPDATRLSFLTDTTASSLSRFKPTPPHHLTVFFSFLLPFRLTLNSVPVSKQILKSVIFIVFTSNYFHSQKTSCHLLLYLLQW